MKDGRKVIITDRIAHVPASAFLSYINSIIKEDAYILADKPYTLPQEIKWKRDVLEKQRSGDLVYLAALYNGRVVASFEARKDKYRQDGNVCFGASVAKDFRGYGLGEKMLRLTISLTKNKFNPKNMYLTVVSANKTALSLYRKVGFNKIIGKYPKWFRRKGKYLEMFALLYVD